MCTSGYHIGVIHDGNRRWANKNGLRPSEGHKKGAKSMELFVNWAIKNPAINEISIYGLSEENFKRNPKELSNLYDIYYKGLSELVGSKTIHDNKYEYSGRREI